MSEINFLALSSNTERIGKKKISGFLKKYLMMLRLRFLTSPKFTFLERNAQTIDNPKLTIKFKKPIKNTVTKAIINVWVSMENSFPYNPNAKFPAAKVI